MTSFEDREKGFERKFAHDEELKFKATARRNRLLGLWAAEQMGVTGEAAQAYAREVIKAEKLVEASAKRGAELRRVEHFGVQHPRQADIRPISGTASHFVYSVMPDWTRANDLKFMLLL
jgi:hypothetical protein